jgi:hypothetical protein
MVGMRIRIEAHALPGRDSSKHTDIRVGVQRRGRNDDILEPVSAGADSASWQFDVTVIDKADGLDLRGPYVQGGPGARFVYLSWGTVEDGTFVMFGRSKLLLAEVGRQVLDEAVQAGMLVGRVGLLDERGKLRMAAIKPPAINWSAAEPDTMN